MPDPPGPFRQGWLKTQLVVQMGLRFSFPYVEPGNQLYARVERSNGSEDLVELLVDDQVVDYQRTSV